MAGAWKGGLSFANATSIGATTSGNSNGTLLPGSSSTFTKSAWTQIIASTTTDISWVSVIAQSLQSAGSQFALDLGVGGSGSEITVVGNLNFDARGGSMFFFPLCVPAGSRIAARYSADAASASLYFIMQGFQDTYQSIGAGSSDRHLWVLTHRSILGSLSMPAGPPTLRVPYACSFNRCSFYQRLCGVFSL